MSIIRSEMPLLARHEGEWKGTYIIIDDQANILDKYSSHVSHQFPQEGSHPYYQINQYQWQNGKFEEHHFPATYKDKKLWFDTSRLQGYAWEVDDSIIMLYFSYKDIPDIYLYEMIHLSRCGNYRNRTLHWFKNNQIYQRTMMQEERVRS